MKVNSLSVLFIFFLLLGLFWIGYGAASFTGFVVGAKNTTGNAIPLMIVGVLSLLLAWLCHYTMLRRRQYRGSG
ncbi:hypothetical protein HZA33_02335 [Candidatus Pacearchaeota archaeon]|nr:hypothetical protein [Candidatus Pacearchaeota archaeon]